MPTSPPPPQDIDDFYQHVLEAHAGLSRDESELFNARLILLLARHVGNPQVLQECVALARQTPPA